MSDPQVLLSIPASVDAAAAAAVNPEGIKALLANSLSTFSIKDKPVFTIDSKSLPKNPHNFNILDSSVFKKSMSTTDPFAKFSRIFKTCVLMNNNSFGKLVHHHQQNLMKDLMRNYLNTIF